MEFITLNFIPHSCIPVMRWTHAHECYQRHTKQKNGGAKRHRQ